MFIKGKQKEKVQPKISTKTIMADTPTKKKTSGSEITAWIAAGVFALGGGYMTFRYIKLRKSVVQFYAGNKTAVDTFNTQFPKLKLPTS